MNEATKYTKHLINFLKDEGFFTDMFFISPEIIEPIIYKKVCENIDIKDDPAITITQFEEIIEYLFVEYYDMNNIMEMGINDLLQQNIIEIAGVNKKGDIVYSLKDKKSDDDDDK